jgi:hypothetical protein
VCFIESLFRSVPALHDIGIEENKRPDENDYAPGPRLGKFDHVHADDDGAEKKNDGEYLIDYGMNLALLHPGSPFCIYRVTGSGPRYRN